MIRKKFIEFYILKKIFFLNFNNKNNKNNMKNNYISFSLRYFNIL